MKQSESLAQITKKLFNITKNSDPQSELGQGCWQVLSVMVREYDTKHLTAKQLDMYAN